MQTRMLLRIVVSAGALLGACLADSAGIRGPVMGYILDARTQALRPVNGIPGAAHLGAPVALPFPVALAAVSSRSDFALLVSASDGRGLYLARNLGAAEPSVGAITGAMQSPTRMALNVADSAAVLYSAEAGRLQVIRGLPENPSAGPLLDVSAVGGPVTALALDSGASNILAAFAGGALHRFAAPEAGDPSDVVQAQSRFISNFAAPAAVTFFNHDRDAVLADAGSNQIFLIRDAAGDPSVFVLAGERDGVSAPVGVEVSADGRVAFIATATALLAIDLETRGIETRAALDGRLTRLDRLQGRTTFVLNEPGNDPLLVLDSAGLFDIYFVPAGRDN